MQINRGNLSFDVHFGDDDVVQNLYIYSIYLSSFSCVPCCLLLSYCMYFFDKHLPIYNVHAYFFLKPSQHLMRQFSHPRDPMHSVFRQFSDPQLRQDPFLGMNLASQMLGQNMRGGQGPRVFMRGFGPQGGLDLGDNLSYEVKKNQ